MSLHSLEPNSLPSGRGMVEATQEIVGDVEQEVSILEIECIRQHCSDDTCALQFRSLAHSRAEL